MKNYNKGIALIFGTALISGFSIWLNAFGVKGIEPSLFAGLKNLSVGIILAALLIGFKEWRQIILLTKKQWTKLVLVGLLGGSIPFILFFNGLAQTTGAKAGFIHKTLFIYVAIMAAFMLKERITKKIWIGLGALLIGQIIFLNIKPTALTLGDAMIFGATLLWAVEIVISKSLLGSLPANIVASARMLFGGIFIWGFLLVTGKWVAVQSLTLIDVNWVIITSLILAAYVLTFYHGLKSVPAHVATSILALGAPITLILQGVFLDKTFTLQHVIGIILITASAAWIVTLFRKVDSRQYVLSRDNQ